MCCIVNCMSHKEIICLYSCAKSSDSWGQLFSGPAHDHLSLFMCVHVHFCVFEATVSLPVTRLWHRGYTGLWRHCSALLSWTKPGVCPREGLASPPKYLLLLLDAHCRKIQWSPALTNSCSTADILWYWMQSFSESFLWCVLTDH